MKVLVDTSVWIRFLAGRAPFSNQLDSLLAQQGVIGHELVYGELLIGDKGGRSPGLRDYRLMQLATVVNHDEVVAFVRDRKLNGRGIGWIDAHLLASAIVGGFRLWTADSRFEAIAKELGIAFTV